MVLENEQHLIEEAKQDPEKFAVLYEHYVSDIYYFLLSRLHNEELAEDMCSLTFAKALQYLPKYKEGNFRAWLYRIANNTLIDHYRKERKITFQNILVLDFFHHGDSRSEIQEKLDKDLALSKLKDAMKNLKKLDQELLTLKYFADMTNAEIAKELKMTESNVAVRLHRVIKKLTKLINEN